MLKNVSIYPWWWWWWCEILRTVTIVHQSPINAPPQILWSFDGKVNHLMSFHERSFIDLRKDPLLFRAGLGEEAGNISYY